MPFTIDVRLSTFTVKCRNGQLSILLIITKFNLKSSQLKLRRAKMKAFPLTSVLFLFVVFGRVRYIYGYEIINGGHYRIQSMEDGLYMNAAYPSAEEDANLGEITTEKWTNSREQRWDVIAFDKARNEYWLFSQENTFNRLTAAFQEGRPAKHIIELMPVGKYRYIIRSIARDACLVNPGRGLKIIYAICNPQSKNQQWEFDILTKQ